MEKGAIISDCGQYRYTLWRVWDHKLPRVCFVMLNPSTADADHDDATIRRCIGFAKSWGYGGIDVVNLYAYRATNSAELHKVDDPIGQLNDVYIRQVCGFCHCMGGIIIAAWGSHAETKRADHVYKMVLFYRVYQIGSYRFPRHPLRLPAALRPTLICLSEP